MAKTVGYGTPPTDLQTSLDGTVTSLADFIYILRPDTTEHFLTTHDKSLTISSWTDAFLEGTYTAIQSPERSNIASKLNSLSDTVELTGFLDNTTFDAADIRGRRFDGSNIYIFRADWRRLQDGPLKLRRGFMGATTIQGDTYSMEVVGLLDVLNDQTLRMYTPTCKADFGDDECGYPLTPPTWTALGAKPFAAVAALNDARAATWCVPTTPNGRQYRCTTSGNTDTTEPVSWNQTIGGTETDSAAVWTCEYLATVPLTIDTVTDARTFTIVNTGGPLSGGEHTDAPDGWFDGGVVTFTSGENSSLSIEVESWVLSTRTLTMVLEFPVAPTGGDTLNLIAGCLKRHDTDCSTFGNIMSFTGEPHLVGRDALFATVENPVT